jgi:tetratricopeptide (TPR) repeat protein
MTCLREEAYIIPAVDLGPENPLPAFRDPAIDKPIDFEANNIPPEDRLGMGHDIGFKILPYKMQDGYSRTLRTRRFSSFILENEYLKVTVLPEVGGKVVSIFYKPLDRELLFHNPVFQPANLALRNAWAAGGIEWNTPCVGHHYLTCSPIHAARIIGLKGEPVLRLYAWERVKCFPYQIDLHLPKGSPFLYAHVKLTNPHDHEISMYWWTNIGMPEYPGGRVLSPADTAYKGLTVRDCPVIDGVDQSYATRVNGAYDLFFRIPDNHRRWEVLVDADGKGMVHTSTDRLRGRKQFAWGMGPGSRRWNEYLSRPGMAYLEIQAGLAYTQTHTLPMLAGAEWSWTEAFGYFESDRKKIHSPDWREAYTEAEGILDGMLSREEVDRFHSYAKCVSSLSPDEKLFAGSGWGALECKRAAANGEKCIISDATPFSEDEISNEQEPWLSLLERGRLPSLESSEEPGAYMIQDSWREMLERSLEYDSDNWLAWYHLGVMKMETGDEYGARRAWAESNHLCRNSWSLRNLAVIAKKYGECEKAVDYLKSAWEIGPKISALAIELGEALIEAGMWDAFENMLGNLPDNVRDHERIRLLAAKVAIRSNNLDLAEELLDWEFATVREGEIVLTDIWYDLQAKKLAQKLNVEVTKALIEQARRELAPPSLIDFRLSASTEEQYVPPQAISGN